MCESPLGYSQLFLCMVGWNCDKTFVDDVFSSVVFFFFFFFFLNTFLHVRFTYWHWKHSSSGLTGPEER